MIVNGAMSVVGALVTSVELAWVLDPAGIVAYALWNIVALAMSIAILLALRRRAQP
jgi:hypothetical protein